MIRWQEFTPAKKWVLIAADPRSEVTAGGIVLTQQLTNAEKLSAGTGRVLKTGSDVEKYCAEKIEPGMRICYRGYLKDVVSDFEKDEQGREVFMIRAEDVWMIVPDETRIGAF